MREIKSDILVKRLLSDMKVGELEPGEAAELREFIDSSDFEKTINAKTKLSVVYEILLSEKEKKGKTKETKKAENILNAATITYWEMNRRKGYERDRQAQSKMRRKWELEASHKRMNPLDELKANLKRIGITKDETVGKILDAIKKVKKLACEIDAIEELNKRVIRVIEDFKSNINYAKQVFSTQPKLIALPDKEFESLLKSMKIEIKKISPEGSM